MAYNKIEYTEIARAQTSQTRDVVISECSKGGFTIAQQVVVDEGGYNTQMFLKGAFHVADIHGLYNIRDAINVAIQEIENQQDEDWDE